MARKMTNNNLAMPKVRWATPRAPRSSAMIPTRAKTMAHVSSKVYPFIVDSSPALGAGDASGSRNSLG